MFKNIGLVVIVALFSLSASAQFWKVTEPVKLEGGVNSDAEESMPVFSADSSILYFTRTFHEDNKGGINDQDIWYSVRKSDGTFEEAKQVNNLNNKFNNAVLGVNQKGDRMYLLNAYSGKRDTEKGIAVAEKKGDGSWGNPSKLNIPNLNIEGDFYGFHVTPDEKTIIISYNGPNSVGEEDLYVSEFENGAWTSPKHMGSVLNSTGFEIAPFLSENKDTIYFSSNGFGGKGSADIFYSVKQSGWDDWSEPENLGAPFNTSGFDSYFVTYGKQAYWSTNRGVEENKSNIYTAKILSPPPFEVEVSPIAASEWGANDGGADITIISGVGPYTYEWSNGSTAENPGNFTAGTYTVTITDALGRTAFAEITVDEPEKVEKVVEEVAMVEKVEGLILFELNSSYLNRKTRKVLDDLIAEIKNMPEVEIIVEAHTDIRESHKYNMWLSKRRMERTKEYLVEKGINAQRITGRYKGKTELAVECEEDCSDEDHQKNRRATIITKRKSSEM